VSDRDVADAIGARLAVLHALDTRTHAVQWFEDDRVLADAMRIDATTTPGRLHGLAVTVKDWIDVEGFPCAGTFASQHDRRPTEDATVVARLRAAGAVVLAKTKAWDGTSNGPPVTHPLDTDRSPGGSSSGEGVVTAAGVSALGVGSDSGGSVRLPAAWCGTYGLKPTTGLVPTTGHYPRVGTMSDGRTQMGFLSADLATIETALGVVAGPDRRDAGVAPVGFDRDPSASLRRFAVLPDDPAFPAAPEVTAAVTRAASRLAEAGMQERAWSWAWLTEARDVTQRYWDRTRLSGAEVASQLWDWDRFRRRFLTHLDDVDVLLSPVAPTVAPRRRTVGTPDFVFTLPASLTGAPALSVPFGHDADGLPLAVQVIGRPWEDATVLAAARAVVRT
jgi:amidase